MKNVGIFGGTFNPPHLAHCITAEYVCEQLMLEKIIFIPSAIPPLKESIITASHRLAMAKLAFADNEKFEVSDIEFRNPDKKSFTVDTLKMLKEEFKSDVRIHLIIGTDNLIELPKWKDPEMLFELSEVIVMNRPGYAAENHNKYFDKVKFISIPHLEISSSMIRERVREGKSIRYLVNDDVRDYIEQNSLYQ